MDNVQTATETEHNIPFLMNVKVTKVDAEKRLVTGVATSEVVDKAGEIVDYATIKKFFQNEELWPGNIREMHQPTAVGKRTSVEFDDDNKVITLTSRVSKGAPETWEKVLDGTLSMYSIGGSGDRKAEKLASGGTAKRIFITNLAEVSLVDNGANPMAKFNIVKMDDGGKLVDAQPEEPTEEPAPVAKAATDGGTEAPIPAAAASEAAPGAAAPSETSADPSPALLDRRSAVLALVTKFVSRPDVAQTPCSVALCGSLVAKVEKLTTADGIEKNCPEPYDIDQALVAISVLERLLANEFWDAKYGVPAGAAPDPASVAQIQMLKTALDFVLQFLVSEHQEQFDAAPDEGGSLVSDDSAVSMAVAATNVLKAGARHSKKDAEMVQQMHDVAKSLGATCVAKDDADDDDDATKLAKAAAAKAGTVDAPAVETAVAKGAVAAVAASDDVTKLASDLSTAQTQLKEQGTVIASLKEQIENVMKMARPGGPQVRAVAKTLGTDAASGAVVEGTPEALTGASMIAALQYIANGKDSNEALKSAAATEITKIIHSGGNGRIDFGLR